MLSAGGCNGMAVLATTPPDHGGRTFDSPSSLDVVAVETMGESMPSQSGREIPETTLGDLKKNRPVEWYGVATAVARRQRVQRLACEREANIKKTDGVDDGVWSECLDFEPRYR